MDDDPLADSRPTILEHMNTDHPDAVARYLRAFRGVEAEPGEARLTAVDTQGFTVTHARLGDFRFDWTTPVAGPDAVRLELVKLAREARLALSPSPPQSS